MYQQLKRNAGERCDIRGQLLQTQAELAEARSELSLWAQSTGPKESQNTDGNGDIQLAKNLTGGAEDREANGHPPPVIMELMHSIHQLSSQVEPSAGIEQGGSQASEVSA